MNNTRPPLRSYETVRREPRCFGESPQFRIDWRQRQTHGYFFEARRSGFEAATPPESETDRYIRDYFSYLMDDSGGCERDLNWLRWVVDCNEGDHLIGPGVRAMVLAGRRDEEIATAFGIPANRIEYYANLFFDVRPYLEQRAVLRQIVPHLRPMSSRSIGSPIECYERLIFPIALEGSSELLDTVLCGVVPTTGELAKEYKRFKSTALILSK